VPVKRDTVVIPESVWDDDGFEYSDVLDELGIGGSAVDMVEVLQVRWNDEVVSRLEAEVKRLGVPYVMEGRDSYDAGLQRLNLGDRYLPLLDSTLDIERIQREAVVATVQWWRTEGPTGAVVEAGSEQVIRRATREERDLWLTLPEYADLYLRIDGTLSADPDHGEVIVGIDLDR